MHHFYATLGKAHVDRTFPFTTTSIQTLQALLSFSRLISIHASAIKTF